MQGFKVRVEKLDSFNLEYNSIMTTGARLFSHPDFYHLTVWSQWFLYKVAPPELKISPMMYFVMYNSVWLSKILKIIVLLEQNFEKTDFYTL